MQICYQPGKIQLPFYQLASIWITICQLVYATSYQICTRWQVSNRQQHSFIFVLNVVVVVVVLNKAYYVPKNSLCGLINNISMRYDFLSSLIMSLRESVLVWQLEKLQPHSYKKGCYGNVDLMSVCLGCSKVVRSSCLSWNGVFASYVFQLNGVNHLSTKWLQ